jgi:hypothetical protein
MDDSTSIVDAPCTPPLRFRRTRIAVSVFFGVLTVAMCVLWVRSYLHRDVFKAREWAVGSYRGEYIIGTLIFPVPDIERGWAYPTGEAKNASYLEARVFGNTLGTSNNCNTSFSGLYMFNVVYSALISTWAAWPWLRRSRGRFSLRTMLTATTLVAVVLGLGVWMLR